MIIVAFDQRIIAAVADVALRHAAAFNVGVDLALDPATPGRIGECDPFGLGDTAPVHGPDLLEVQHPLIAFRHHRSV
jgi:hypothetical protein